MDKNTILLMHMNDNTFKDEYGNIVTNSGVTLDTDNKVFGNGSAYFNGNYLVINNNEKFNLSNNDFTIDFWIKSPNQLSNASIFTSDIFTTPNWTSFNGGFIVEFLNNSISLSYNATSPGIFSKFTIGSPVYNEFCHIALVRYNNSLIGFINGKLTNNITINNSIVFDSKNNTISLGRQDIRTNYPLKNSNIDEFRISNIARWTEDFIPLTREYERDLYLIKQQSNYYSIKKEYYESSKDEYNSPLIDTLEMNDFESYGIDDLSSIHSNALNKLIDNKYNIAMLK